MGLINYEQIPDKAPATANLFNSKFGQLVAAINGNIDTANLKNLGVTTEKLADSAVVATKIGFNTFFTTDVFAVGNDLLIQSGWGYITGTNGNQASTTLVYPTPYSVAPILLLNNLGYKLSDPTAISDFSTDAGAYIVGRPNANGQSAVVRVLGRDASSNLATARSGYSWMAIGKRE